MVVSQRLGVACRLPDCAKVVVRNTSAGRPKEFCGDTHRKRFERQRASLQQVAADLEARIELAPTATAKRSLAADLVWIRRVLRAYI